MPKYQIKAIETKEIYKSNGVLYTDEASLRFFGHYIESLGVIEAESSADALRTAGELYEYKLDDGPGNRHVQFEVMKEIEDN